MLKRQFSSSATLRLQKLYTARKVLGFLPQPVKTFGTIMAGTAVSLLLAPGLILLVAPPLMVGSWYMFRQLRRVKNELHDKRWRELASYHLRRDDRTHGSTINFDARTRITNALIANEESLGDLIGDPRSQDLTFTALESLAQDFKASSSGIAESLKIEQYGLIMGGKRRATVTLVTKDDRTRIEIKPKSGKMVVIEGNENADVIDI